MDREPALITGASAGIGKALAEVFAANGHELLLVARSAERLSAVCDSLSARHGVPCRWIAMDLERPEAPHAIFRQAQRLKLRIGVLVNNAGALCEGPFADQSIDRQLALLRVNVLAATTLSHLFLKPMLKRGRGRLLNIASMSAFNPAPTLAVYAASKAFLLSLSEALSIETRGTGVTVTAVCPGFTQTAMIARGNGESMRLPLIPNMTPEAVAEQSYHAMLSGRTVFVPGSLNRFALSSVRLSPRWLRREFIARVERWGI